MASEGNKPTEKPFCAGNDEVKDNKELKINQDQHKKM